MKRAQGQALIEALVALLLLLPLWIGVAYFSEWNHADFQVRQAARALVFEQAAQPTGPFLTPAATVYLLPVATSGFTQLQTEHAAVARVRVSGAAQRLSSVSLQIAGSSAAAVHVAGGVLADTPPARATVRVSLQRQRLAPRLAASDPQPTLHLPRDLQLLTDDWSARDLRELTARMDPWVPTGVLAAATAPLRAMEPVIALFEPAIRELCVGRIDPEVVPADRLVGQQALRPRQTC